MNETLVTLVGNAATGVEYRETASGGMSRFRLAVTPRRWDREKQLWSDGRTSFYTVWAWRSLASHLAASVSVGEPLLVHGRLKVRDEERDGGRRTFVDVEAVAVGHDMGRGTSAFRRPVREDPAFTAGPVRAGAFAGAGPAPFGAGGPDGGAPGVAPQTWGASTPPLPDQQQSVPSWPAQSPPPQPLSSQLPSSLSSPSGPPSPPAGFVSAGAGPAGSPPEQAPYAEDGAVSWGGADASPPWLPALPLPEPLPGTADATTVDATTADAEREPAAQATGDPWAPGAATASRRPAPSWSVASGHVSAGPATASGPSLPGVVPPLPPYPPGGGTCGPGRVPGGGAGGGSGHDRPEETMRQKRAGTVMAVS